MRFQGLLLSVPISTDVQAKRVAYEDPDTGVAEVADVAGRKCVGLFVEDTRLEAGLAAIQVTKVAPATFGGAVKINDSLMSDSQGRLVKATGATGDKVWCLGFSRSVIAQAGDEGEVLIQPHEVVI